MITRRAFTAALSLTGLGLLAGFSPLKLIPDAMAQSATDVAKPVALPDMADPEGHLAALREEAGRLSRDHDLARGSLQTDRQGIPDVAEAEEAAESARAELARVRELAATIDATLQLLRSAQDRVHRDLAPILGQAVGRWLPTGCRAART